MELHSTITWHDVIDSTNSEARRVLPYIDNLSVIAAERQTAGRGQGDHKWHSMAGVNLTFTAVFKFHHPAEHDTEEKRAAQLDVKDALYITQIVTLALRLYLDSHGVKARIKWPNDIYVGDKKICGILIENVLSGSNVDSSIVGIGLNINQTDFPADLPNPISLAILTGKSYDVHKELQVLMEYIAQCLDKSNTEEGRAYLDTVFNEYMFRLDA